ncbi:GIY-YIG nuclease family protein [Endozoicomonas sp. ISHI1]|uniref:GIY-YIG nuclease family protein n=1 Tax=Endozoicomonas sp. ISHI1 TaxID=2825882 RepID=UPI0035A13893
MLALDGETLFTQGHKLVVPDQPGVYVIHDLRGPLYVGKTERLSRRFSQHYYGSHNRPLRNALNISVGSVRFSWIICNNSIRLNELEQEVITMLQPSCNLT